MPRARLAALLAAAALAGAVLGACGRQSESVGNPGEVPATGTVQTNPGSLKSHTTTEPNTTQPGGSVTTTQP
jgi:hypothetical protein